MLLHFQEWTSWTIPTEIFHIFSAFVLIFENFDIDKSINFSLKGPVEFYKKTAVLMCIWHSRLQTGLQIGQSELP